MSAGYVYVLQEGLQVKVGTSINPKHRAKFFPLSQLVYVSEEVSAPYAVEPVRRVPL